jgi:exodeoxyribonuclease VII small subunit
MAKANDPKPPQSFEAAVSELDNLVASMEGGQLSLEASLAAYKRGAELLKFCQGALADAQQQIKVLEGDVLKDWEGDSDSD